VGTKPAVQERWAFRAAASRPAADRETLEFARDVVLGLSDHPRSLPSRYLYDERGSELFQRIAELPEYYLTRTETRILEQSAGEIRDITGAVAIVELGAGHSVKTRLLLAPYAAHATTQYFPVDVSRSALGQTVRSLAACLPSVLVEPLPGTYDAALPKLARRVPSMLVFLGSSVGNLNRTEALAFWQSATRHLKAGDYVLLGVDLVKDRSIIDAAYNDGTNCSAEFARNVFVRMNRELGAGVDITAINHVAGYDPEWQRVEIYAQFDAPQTVHVRPLGITIPLAAGDRVCTEISRKFTVEDLTRYLGVFGLRLRRVFTDEHRWFALLLLRKEAHDITL
jgi:L-histidine N-alpha-methyltransferase